MLTSEHSYSGSLHRIQNLEPQERIQLVNKYRDFFSSTLVSQGSIFSQSIIKQRPVCWPLSQIEKFMDEFYDESFIKNTQQILNGSKKLNDSLSNDHESGNGSHIAEAL
jgi:hypothetical protein